MRVGVWAKLRLLLRLVISSRRLLLRLVISSRKALHKLGLPPPPLPERDPPPLPS